MVELANCLPVGFAFGSDAHWIVFGHGAQNGYRSSFSQAKSPISFLSSPLLQLLRFGLNQEPVTPLANGNTAYNATSATPVLSNQRANKLAPFVPKKDLSSVLSVISPPYSKRRPRQTGDAVLTTIHEASVSQVYSTCDLDEKDWAEHLQHGWPRCEYAASTRIVHIPHAEAI
jgi:hypothetical protein